MCQPLLSSIVLYSYGADICTCYRTHYNSGLLVPDHYKRFQLQNNYFNRQTKNKRYYSYIKSGPNSYFSNINDIISDHATSKTTDHSKTNQAYYCICKLL